MFDVIWYDGWHEHCRSFATKADALSFIADTAMDPDEFDIVESEDAN